MNGYNVRKIGGSTSTGKVPPPPAIRNWIEVKPVNPYPLPNGKTPSIEQLTFLISRKIANEGIEPTHFFDEAKEQALRQFSEAIDKAIEADVDAFIEEQVEKMLETWLGKK